METNNMKDYLQKRITELTNERANNDLLIEDHKAAINEIIRSNDFVDVKIAELENVLIECNSHAHALIKVETCEPIKKKLITFDEPATPVNGKKMVIESANITGFKNAGIYSVRKKNEHGMPVLKNRLNVSLDWMRELKEVIHEHKKIHVDDIGNMTHAKYSILGTFLDEHSGADGEFSNICYGNCDGGPKKYLYWDEG